MLKFKRGDKVIVLDVEDKPMNGKFVCLSYRKDPFHYQVDVNIPGSMSRTGFKTVSKYFVESKFVL